MANETTMTNKMGKSRIALAKTIADGRQKANSRCLCNVTRPTIAGINSANWSQPTNAIAKKAMLDLEKAEEVALESMSMKWDPTMMEMLMMMNSLV